jgi:NAD(P)-dependent dehydrogenase (short-subunit alcohol dehydrogenase family)
MQSSRSCISSNHVSYADFPQGPAAHFKSGGYLRSIEISTWPQSSSLAPAKASALKRHSHSLGRDITVFATMRSPAKSPKLAEVAASENLPIIFSQMDVDPDESVRAAIAPILASGPLDVLINNAGVESVGSIEEQPLSHFRAIMENNYFGAIRCVQAVVPAMCQRRSGSILNVSSVAGRLSTPPLTAYCASKWALEALSEALAGDMKTFNVRVTLIKPGIIDTAMAQRIGTPSAESPYRQAARYAALFTNSVQPVPPSLVANKVLDVFDSGTWKLRHLVGPDAVPFIELSKSMTYEEWIEVNGAADDAVFFAKLSG